jgi:hypothetical protein
MEGGMAAADAAIAMLPLHATMVVTKTQMATVMVGHR